MKRRPSVLDILTFSDSKPGLGEKQHDANNPRDASIRPRGPERPNKIGKFHATPLSLKRTRLARLQLPKTIQISQSKE